MHKTISFSVLAMALALVPAAAGAADLPKATQKALADLKLEPSFMNGLEAELNVPQAWIDGAKTEDAAIILGTWDNTQFPRMIAPFQERYPDVKLKYNRTGTAGRGMQVLVSLAQGRVNADVTTSIADATFQFAKMKALADLRELPGFKNLDPDYSADDGTWASFKLSYRCIGYNTKLVKKSDLPATWDDLLTNPIWHNRNLALSNHPNAWLLNLWAVKGEDWGRNFTKKLFEDVKPQQRKEGMSANTALTVAGEFYANIPAPEWRAEGFREKGAPIGYHCPAPVPITVSQIVILEKAPNKNGARLFVNWMLSREGQLLQYAETSAVPVHKAMQLPRFLPFADTIVGKSKAVRKDEILGSDLHQKLVGVWNSYWTATTTKKGKKGKKKSAE